MPARLERRQQTGDLHYVTTSCHGEFPHLASAVAATTFELSLESHRLTYGFAVYGYVVMPTHVHLLISEPPSHPLSTILGALKRSVSKRLPQSPFWLPRYYDRNIYTDHERVEKLRYMHRNPVTAGLAASPGDYLWSSFNAYYKGEQGRVSIDTGFYFSS